MDIDEHESEKEEVFLDGLDEWFADPVNNHTTIEAIREREIVHDQRSDAWFEARKEMLTGSRIAASLGIDPRTSQNDLLLKSIGLGTPTPENSFTRAALDWGIEHEPHAIAAYEELSGEKVEKFSLVRHEKVPWLGGSPDGIVLTKTGKLLLIETKCPWKRKIVYGKVPEYYLPQLYVNMRCAKIHEAVYIEYVPGQELNVVHVPFDNQWWAENWPKLVRYWNRYLFYQTMTSDTAMRIEDVVKQCERFDFNHCYHPIRPKGKLAYLLRKHRREQGTLQEGEANDVDTWPKPKQSRKRKPSEEEPAQAQTFTFVNYDHMFFPDSTSSLPPQDVL